MDEQTLEPCPFCGGEATTHEHSLEATWGVGCTKCPAVMNYVGFDEAEAIASWNRCAAQGVMAGKVAERRELDDLCAKIEADAVAGLRYIEAHYGRLEGVGWDRVFDAHDELFSKAAALSPHPKGME